VSYISLYFSLVRTMAAQRVGIPAFTLYYKGWVSHVPLWILLLVFSVIAASAWERLVLTGCVLPARLESKLRFPVLCISVFGLQSRLNSK
jgi:hypothetical protein